MENKGLTVNVFDLHTGLTTYENVSYVRIVSSDYNLLVMLDYLPIIGEIKGKVDIKTPDGELHFDNIKASYMNSNNVFNLMIQGDLNE
ncbi:MAG: hypothetical protein E7164_03515 [Firmicutes bacterium]|nr:hypothetical protein [Bacillota bacterium]